MIILADIGKGAYDIQIGQRNTNRTIGPDNI